MCDNDQLLSFLAASCPALFHAKPKENICSTTYVELIFRLDPNMSVEDIVNELKEEQDFLVLYVYNPTDACFEQKTFSAVLKDHTGFSAHIMGITNCNGLVDSIFVQNYHENDLFTERMRLALRETATLPQDQVPYIASEKELILALMS